MKKLIQKTHSNQQKDVDLYCRCYIYIHALLVERITMPTQTALRVRGDKAASLQLAEICSMLQLNSMPPSHKAG